MAEKPVFIEKTDEEYFEIMDTATRNFDGFLSQMIAMEKVPATIVLDSEVMSLTFSAFLNGYLFALNISPEAVGKAMQKRQAHSLAMEVSNVTNNTPH